MSLRDVEEEILQRYRPSEMQLALLAEVAPEDEAHALERPISMRRNATDHGSSALQHDYLPLVDDEEYMQKSTRKQRRHSFTSLDMIFGIPVLHHPYVSSSLSIPISHV